MAWQDVMLPTLRVMVNDIAATTYPDDTLEQVLVVAAMQVSQETRFSQNFRADIANVDIAPDPTADATLDDSYTNLVCLKAACIVNTGDAATAASQAIAVKDGTSSIDLRGALDGKMKLLREGWCAVYKDARTNYQCQAVEAAGAAVMTPFRIFAFGPGYLRGTPGNFRPDGTV